MNNSPEVSGEGDVGHGHLVLPRPVVAAIGVQPLVVLVVPRDVRRCGIRTVFPGAVLEEVSDDQGVRLAVRVGGEALGEGEVIGVQVALEGLAGLLKEVNGKIVRL